MVKFKDRCGKLYWTKRGGLKVQAHCKARKGHFLPCSWLN